MVAVRGLVPGFASTVYETSGVVPVPELRDSRTHPLSTDAFHVHSVALVVMVNEPVPPAAPMFRDGGDIE
jgi:hypothetical protein